MAIIRNYYVTMIAILGNYDMTILYNNDVTIYNVTMT